MLDETQVLDRYFPEVRAWLIQTAAAVDRYERAGGEPATSGDERLRMYREALAVLSDSAKSSDRAERIQMIFSDPYPVK